MNIGVFFGSFNPIHKGHVAIAQRFLQEDGIDQVWLSVSPHNPLKEKNRLLKTELRVKMAQIALVNSESIKVVDFEKDLSQPSYTYEALLALNDRFPEHTFTLLIGGDNCGLFNQWRNYDKILRHFSVWAYPRSKSDISDGMEMKIIDAPLLDFASTNIRLDIQIGKSPEGLPQGVYDFIKKNKLYQQ